MTNIVQSLVQSEVLDRINSVVELAILLPFAADCFHIYRVRTSISINPNSMLCWVAYCVWTALFFYGLDQTYSCLTGVVWIIAYLIKIYIVYRYRPPANALELPAP
jgi:hypothetical protein